MKESQRKAVCWMWYNLFDACRGGVLADSMANNLVQVTHFLHGLCLPRLVFKCLVIVPTQCVDLWVSALLQLAPRLRVVEFTGAQRERRLAQVLQLGGIVVTTYGIAVNDIVPKSNSEGEDDAWDVIVFDGADRLKDSTSKTNAALSRLQGNVNLLLTTHPILHNLKDLYTLFDFACEADLFGSYGTFKDRYESVVSRAQGKRSDDMDRQLATVARAQVAEMIDAQYWQNWEEIVTPGGSKRPDVVPAFIDTPTPFKSRPNKTNGATSSHHQDPSSTPSFSRTKSIAGRVSKTSTNPPDNTGLVTPKPTKTPGTKKSVKKSTKNKPLMLDVIDLEPEDAAMNLADLENRLANLDVSLLNTPSSGANISASSSSKSALIRTPTGCDVGKIRGKTIDLEAVNSLETTSMPTRRTPIRNAFFVSHSPSKSSSIQPPSESDSNVKANSEHSSLSTTTTIVFSPESVRERQRLSFGRISLLEEGESMATLEEDDLDLEPAEHPSSVPVSTPSRAVRSAMTSLSSPLSATPSTKRQLEKSLTAHVWPSTESFLRRREVLALELFEELNRVIFGSRLPPIALVWRKMKNCAGIYHYKDSSVTLSKSLLTNSQRLCSTLAHEMAHAATHLLDDCPNDRHGPVWQKWARIGHARYPNIVTGSVYHNYCSQNPDPEAEEEKD